jgi:hypothetical protein
MADRVIRLQILCTDAVDIWDTLGEVHPWHARVTGKPEVETANLVYRYYGNLPRATRSGLMILAFIHDFRPIDLSRLSDGSGTRG